MPLNEYMLPGDTLPVCLSRLNEILDTIPAQLREIEEQDFSNSPAPGKWSKKQIIGHLIDSAANNHQRFIRGQFENQPAISYDQEKWNEAGHYTEMHGQQVIDFWEAYNRHILQLIRCMPEDQLQKECTMGDGSTWPLSRLFMDYVRHMEHHLKQIGL